MTTITGVVARDLRFPTSDYSAAYANLKTGTDLECHGYSIEMKSESLEVYEFPVGSAWTEKQRSSV